MRIKIIKLSLFFCMNILLVSCGKTNKTANTPGISPSSKEAFLNSKYIQALCKSEDNAANKNSLEIYIASPQDNLEKLSASFSVDATPSNNTVQFETIENIVLSKSDTILEYSGKDCSLSIDLSSKLAPYKVKGTVNYLSDGEPVQREVSCLIEELE